MSMGLGLKLGLGSGGPTKSPICDAIAAKVMITATHNRRTITLAPHIVYKRGKDAVITLDAVPQGGISLRSYTVAKLTDIKSNGVGFVPVAGFDPDIRRYREKTICVVKLD